MKTINRPDDFPAGETRFAILEFVTIHIPGDERSQTYPGHGYPASTETAAQLRTFESQADLELWLSHEGRNKVNYIVLQATRLGVRTSVSIELER